MRLGLLAVFCVCAGVSAAVACGGESKLTVVIEEGANARRANLPAVPTLPPPPPTYVTGSTEIFTIYGVRHLATKNLSKQVQVRGFIVDVYTPMVPNARPPRICGERDHCLEDKPHVYIADSATEADQEKWMMVTGYAAFQQDIDDARRAARNAPATPATPTALQQAGLQRPVPTDFYQGAQVTVRGTFVRRAPNGMANSAGVLDYLGHTTDVPSPTAPPARR